MIQWPEKYRPERAGVYVRNELEMPVQPDLVWAWLVRADLWPSWYSNSQNVVIHGRDTELKQGSVFHWKTFGVYLESRVEEFVPSERLSWSSRSRGIDSYHAWLIEKRQSGCHVLMEETQNGLLPRLSNALRPHHVSKYHQAWLEGLFSKAKGGPPPPASAVPI